MQLFLKTRRWFTVTPSGSSPWVVSNPTIKTSLGSSEKRIDGVAQVVSNPANEFVHEQEIDDWALMVRSAPQLSDQRIGDLTPLINRAIPGGQLRDDSLHSDLRVPVDGLKNIVVCIFCPGRGCNTQVFSSKCPGQGYNFSSPPEWSSEQLIDGVAPVVSNPANSVHEQ